MSAPTTSRPATPTTSKAAAHSKPAKTQKSTAVKNGKPTVVKAAKPAAVKAGKPAVVKAGKPAVVKAGKPAVVKAARPAAVKAARPAATKAAKPTDVTATLSTAAPTSTAKAAMPRKKKVAAAVNPDPQPRTDPPDDPAQRAATATGRGWGSKTRWMVAAVLGVLAFQVVHSAEHVAQAIFWLFNPTVAPWMSGWAMALTNGLAALSGGSPALGMELLHLIGNAVFLGGLLLATRLPEQYRNGEMKSWLRLAIIVEAAHLAEHVLLTATVAAFGRPLGLSTMFGLLSYGEPASIGFRVAFHLVVNLVALSFSLKAALAVARPKAAATGRRFDWVRAAVLFSPLAGLIFLVPVFGGHVVHGAAADDVIVATVNGQNITNGQLQAEVDALANQRAALELNPSAAQAAGVSAEGQQVSEDQIQYGALNTLVQAALIEQGAQELGITLTDADVTARRNQLIETDFLGAANYERFLAANNVSAEYAERQIRNLLMEERVQQQLTSSFLAPASAVASVFAEQYEPFPRGRHLLTASEALAQQFLAQVVAGADFEQLIREESTDPRAQTSAGYMGTVREGAQVSEMVEAVNSLTDGEYGVVQTQFGWHVVQRLAPPTFAEVEAEIRTNLRYVEMGSAGQAWVAERRAAAEVSIEAGFGIWDTQFGAVVAPEPSG